VIELTVEMNRKQNVLQLPEGSTVEQLLDSLGLYPDAHIVVRGKVPIPIDSPVIENDLLRILKVASGG